VKPNDCQSFSLFGHYADEVYEYLLSIGLTQDELS
jgi:hypothetical protein